MNHMLRWLFLFGLGFVNTACSSPPPEPRTDMHPAYTVIDQGIQSGLTLSKQLVITTPGDWQELWSVHQSIRRPGRPLPAVDFTTDMIIAVFMGERPTGGYRLQIHDLEMTADHLRVNLLATTPARDAMLTMALTQPYVIIKTARTTLPVEFNLLPSVP